jgi:hypothetical protein
MEFRIYRITSNRNIPRSGAYASIPGDYREEDKMYDSKYWKHGCNVTVRQLYEYMQQNIPDDAIVCIGGSNEIFTHLSTDGSAFSLDFDSLSDLEEYEGSEPSEMLEIP